MSSSGEIHLSVITVVFNGSPQFRDIPNAYIQDGDLDYAHAMTVHMAQGLTCDRAYVLGGEELYVEAGYTALSRGRLENRLYITEQDTETDHHGADPPDEAIDSMRDALSRWSCPSYSAATSPLRRRGG